MLRLRKIKRIAGDAVRENGRIKKDEQGEMLFEPDSLHVVFEGHAGEFAAARFTLHMNLRPDDATLISDAARLLSDAIAALHREHCAACPSERQAAD
jgi:hypothetical protein